MSIFSGLEMSRATLIVSDASNLALLSSRNSKSGPSWRATVSARPVFSLLHVETYVTYTFLWRVFNFNWPKSATPNTSRVATL